MNTVFSWPLKRAIRLALVSAFFVASSAVFAEPVMIVSFEVNGNGINVVKKEVRDIAFKRDREGEKAKRKGQFKKARAGGWVAQVIRPDGSVESETAIHDPRQIRGEFEQADLDHNDRVDVEAESGVFDLMIPVTSNEVSVRIIDRKTAKAERRAERKATKAMRQAASASDEMSDQPTDFDDQELSTIKIRGK